MHQAPLSMGFPRQGYWSGWPFPSPVYLYFQPPEHMRAVPSSYHSPLSALSAFFSMEVNGLLAFHLVCTALSTNFGKYL